MAALRDKHAPLGAFGEGRRIPTKSEPAPKGTYGADAFDDADLDGEEADALVLTVPPGERPSVSGVPGSIEEAVLQMLEQVPTSKRTSSPELPPGAVPSRRPRR